MRKYLIFGLFAILSAACARPAAQVEKVEVCTEVGDYGMLVDAIEITVTDPCSLRGLKAADFDLTNNVSGAFLDAATGKAPEAYEDDGIVLSRKGNVLRIEATPFNKAAIPCCAMDPIVPIHQVEEKYPGQFTDDVEKAWQGKVVYKWDGSEMVLGPMDVDAFVKLPMYFVHAETDKTCKVASTYAYSEARKRLGATQDKVLIYSDENLVSWGVAPMMAHFSWVPLLDDYSEGSPMQWLISQF